MTKHKGIASSLSMSRRANEGQKMSEQTRAESRKKRRPTSCSEQTGSDGRKRDAQTHRRTFAGKSCLEEEGEKLSNLSHSAFEGMKTR